MGRNSLSLILLRMGSRPADPLISKRSTPRKMDIINNGKMENEDMGHLMQKLDIPRILRLEV